MFGKGAIILVLGFIILFGMISIQLNGLENNAIGNMSYYHTTTQSHNLATAGANVGVSLMYQDSSRRGEIANQTFTSGVFVGGSYVVNVDDIDALTIRLRSSSRFGKYKDTIEVYFDKATLQSFTIFAWMSDNEGNVFWVTGDTVWGKVHSNGNLHIAGSPVFWEKVTTSKTIDPKPGSGTSKGIYKKGYETGIATVTLPTDINEIIAASTGGGRQYNRQVWVTLSPGSSANNDGKVYVRYTATGPIKDSISLSDPTFNGVIYGTDSVCVQGTLDGQLTIASGENVYVVDDCYLEKNPMSYPSSDDVLGLVGAQNVIVADPVPGSSNATTNVHIEASIFALAGSFTAENYNSRKISNSGDLNVLGAIIQKDRGPVGTAAGGVLKTGFSKNYRYDDRLANNNFRPPYFPGFYRKTLAIKNWWENVRIPEF